MGVEPYRLQSQADNRVGVRGPGPPDADAGPFRRAARVPGGPGMTAALARADFNFVE